MDTAQVSQTQNQLNADNFYRALQKASAKRIARISREAAYSARLGIIIRDSGDWRRRYALTLAAAKVGWAATRNAERDRIGRNLTQRRHYVTALTRDQLPARRLGPRRTNASKNINKNTSRLFYARMLRSSARTVQRLHDDSTSAYQLWSLMHPFGGPVSDSEITDFHTRARRKYRPILRRNPNDITPVGMDLERALTIAAAAAKLREN